MKYEECCYNCKHCSPKCADNADVDIKEAKCYDFELRDELAKIENGTLIELPCKVGDTVYVVNRFRSDWIISEQEVRQIIVSYGGAAQLVFYDEDVLNLPSNRLFFTKEAAAKRLCELIGEKQ